VLSAPVDDDIFVNDDAAGHMVDENNDDGIKEGDANTLVA
jgi:hypothetical protein